MKKLLILLLLVPSLSWGKKVLLDCDCKTYKLNSISKYQITDNPIESCDKELSININTKKKLINGQGRPFIFYNSEEGYFYREENNSIITNKSIQLQDGTKQDIGLSLNRKNGNMKVNVQFDYLIKDEIRGDFRLFAFHKYKFNCQVSDSKKLF